ncbi:hypothetical protein EJ06DRAFT_584741 [Trichodelitschia bisporula]|uniref:Uncharacterized protein n=1 Tax=Trichodelitschia bisporula TaxID=703511 RepID=A0A6G1HNE3_9PEZI|nr:hypothetical protein EJ06DRAFT_584741 [Trichodelitschia bisporula]
MFRFPDSQAVARTDLDSSPTPPPSPPPALLSALEARAPLTFAPAPERISEQVHEDETEVEFRLFATEKPRAIRVRSPTPNLNPGFVAPRPEGWYRAPGPDDRMHAAAVTGRDVGRWAGVRWPGMTYSWRVVRVRGEVKAGERVEGKIEGEEQRATKKKRKGKKMRIALREKIKMEKEKEVQERAKKARRNREKKFKKRARDKVKRAAARGEEGEGGSGSGSDDGGSE